jgi:predicted Zn-dependent protease with MMP-like domain
MPHPKLLRLAETEVARVMDRLPEAVRLAAEECLVSYEDSEDAEDSPGDDDGGGEDDEGTGDLLGLFEGYSRLDPEPPGPGEMPRVRLFLDNLWDYAEGDESTYRDEVRITYLHELGHYLGWGEEEIAELGLA